ncbi:YafY family protein [Paenibacillus sp. sptzw28]|uniref:helix-turn-helix transcriptional regulator n=1 Tax=Paenibacillus sp. sptzw28 TaxID=715179 RepID=UPI002162CE90|nr:WYL domain-containing protein [Paenibacillus sp. sptzw28]
MHRIQWFDQQIRAGNYPNSSRLARQFEISKRQAQRDIEYLEISLRAPLIYVARNRGYCYEDKTYSLPLLYMTEEENKMLKYLAYRYRQYNYDNAAAVNRVAHLLDRFTEEKEAESFGRLPVFAADPRIIQSIELLSYAIRECLAVHFTYRDQNKEEQYTVCPLKIVSNYNADYVFVLTDQGNRKNSFRLDGIQHITVTAERFDLPASIGTHEWGAPLPARKPFTAKVRLMSPLYGGAWKGYRVVSSEELVYEIEFFDTDSFLQHLLVTEWEQLLSPKWLKEKLSGRCRQMLDRLQYR